jgi:hypothetical protein
MSSEDQDKTADIVTDKVADVVTDKVAYIVTKKAGLRVAGIRVAAGDSLLLTEEEARYELLNGTIVPEGEPSTPSGDDAPTADADIQTKKKR